MSLGFLSSVVSSARAALQQGSETSQASPAKAAAPAAAAADKFVAAKSPQGSDELFGRLAGTGREMLQHTSVWQAASVLLNVVLQAGATSAMTAGSMAGPLGTKGTLAPALKCGGPTSLDKTKLEEFVAGKKNLFPRGLPEIEMVDPCTQSAQGLYADGVAKIRNDLQGKVLESTILHETLHHQATGNGFRHQAGGVEDGIIEVLLFDLYKGDKEVIGASPYKEQAMLIAKFVKLGLFSKDQLISILTAKDKAEGQDMMVSKFKAYAYGQGLEVKDISKIEDLVDKGDLGGVMTLFLAKASSRL